MSNVPVFRSDNQGFSSLLILVLIIVVFAVVTTLAKFVVNKDNPDVLPASGDFENTTLNPLADSYVKKKYEDKNYGTETIVSVDGGSYEMDAFIKFDLSSYEDVNLEKATLKLYVDNGSKDIQDIKIASNISWEETTITYLNRPIVDSFPITVISNAPKNNWIEFDVTSSLSNKLGDIITFVLETSNGDRLSLGSRESDNKPELVLDFIPTDPEPDPIPDPDPDPLPEIIGIWKTADELASLPMSGTAWDNLMDGASEDTSDPDISDQDDKTDTYVLAKALVYARTGQSSYRTEAKDAIMTAIGTEGGTSTGILAVGRNLQSYVIAADLIKLSDYPLDDAAFRIWLETVRSFIFQGGGGDHSIISCHEERPNNFGTHCGASRVAIARYLGDDADLERAADVFKGWLDDRSSYTGFSFGELDWQCDQENPVGINSVGCTKDGHSIDGVLPDDQRRGGDFTWPPQKENYAWEALQGATVEAEMLTRAGYPAWEWESQALKRAVTWLHDQADYPAEGDDEWIIWLVNKAYGSDFLTNTPTSSGKGMGWTDWTHQ